MAGSITKGTQMTWEQQLSDIGRTIDTAMANDAASIVSLTNENIRLTNEVNRLQAIIDAVEPPVDPPPVEPPPAPGKLRFKPPVLASDAVVINQDLGQSIPSTLDIRKDYIIKLSKTTPRVAAGTGIQISGGKNVVIIGGEVIVKASGGICRAFYVKDNVGTVHLEGVKFRPESGNFTEGINNASPSTVLQVQNVNVAGLCSGSQATNHADIIQTWNGPKSLKVDGLKGRTNYQCAFLNARDTNKAAAPLDDWEMHRCDFESVNGAKYTMWLVPPPASVKTSQIHCWGPSLGAWKPEMWPGIINTKPTEDFTGGAGLSYVSPGYV